MGSTNERARNRRIDIDATARDTDHLIGAQERPKLAVARAAEPKPAR